MFNTTDIFINQNTLYIDIKRLMKFIIQKIVYNTMMSQQMCRMSVSLYAVFFVFGKLFSLFSFRSKALPFPFNETSYGSKTGNLFL